MSVKDKAVAIDRFVRTIKASGVYDDIQAACIMAGWTNLAGALYPLKGAAPTNNGFLAADLDAGIGLKGDGSSKYLNSNRDASDDPQNDHHASIYCSSVGGGALYGAGAGQVGSTNGGVNVATGNPNARSRNNAVVVGTQVGYSGTYVASRSSSTSVDLRWKNETQSFSQSSQATVAKDMWVFARNEATLEAYSDATISWYSIGSATDLAALDSAVSTLMADLRAIDEAGFDRDALAYIRNVEAADGSYLETGVKQAINAFVAGCKKDGIWDAIKASCIMCGARTISGALVPLVGPSPTAYPQPVNFVSADYDRSSGLKGDGATKYLDSNRAGNADGQDDHHLAVYMSSADTGSSVVGVGAAGVAGSTNFGNGSANVFARSRCAAAYTQSPTGFTGFMGISREEPSGYDYRYDSSTTPVTQASDGLLTDTTFIFARNESGTPNGLSSSRLTFYSIGSSLDLAALDNRVSTLVAAIGAAI